MLKSVRIVYPQQLSKTRFGGRLQTSLREGNSGNQVCSTGQCFSDVIVHSLCFLKAHFYPFVWKYKIKHKTPQTRTNSSRNEGDPALVPGPAQLCHSAGSHPAPLSISPRAGLAPHSQLLYPPGFNMKPHREKPPPSGPRNLRGEAGLGAAPAESLQETMDVLRGREKGRRKKNQKCIICYLAISL